MYYIVASGLDGDTVLDKAHVEEITEYLIEMKIKYMSGLAFPPKDDVSMCDFNPTFKVIILRKRVTSFK